MSATAGEQGNGGNVNIDSKFIIAIPKEDSDIKEIQKRCNRCFKKL
ncbi:hypothetical protein [Brunnivagina elsteri]|nr:hypothetical protein [Calothrix elsteri]